MFTKIISGVSFHPSDRLSSLIPIEKIVAHTQAMYEKLLRGFSPADRLKIIDSLEGSLGIIMRLSSFLQSDDLDQFLKIELAKIIAAQDGQMMSIVIKDFQIANEKNRVDIAKIALVQDPQAFSVSVGNYDISNEDTRVELAKMAARQDCFQVSLFFENYDIVDPQKRMELVAFFAMHDGSAVSSNFNRYGIERTDQRSRTHIATLSSLENGRQTSRHIKKYAITDPQARLRVFCLAMANDFHSFFHIDRYALPGTSTPDVPIIHHTTSLSQKITLLTHDDHKKTGEHWLKTWQSFLSIFFLHITNRQLATFLGDSLYDMKAPALRYQLLANLIDLINQPDQWSQFKTQFAAIQSHEWSNERQNQSLTLASVLAAFKADPKFTERLLATKLSRQTHKQLLGTLLQLKITPLLSTQDKDHIFQMIFNDTANLSAANYVIVLKQRCRWLNTLLNYKLYSDVTLSTSALEWPEILHQHFIASFNLHHIEDFAEKYEKTIGRFRREDALMMYAGKMQFAGTIAQKLLNTYVQTVLEGTFHRHRASDPHLTTVFEEKDALALQWQNGESQSLSLFLESLHVFPLQNSATEPSFDLYDYLKRVIVSDHHLSFEKYSHLYDYLQHPESAERIKKDLLSALNHSAKSFADKKDLNLQHVLILAMTTHEHSEKQTALEKAIKAHARTDDFYHDLIYCLSQLDLQKKKTKMEGLILKDTDDPNDLLLAGTEVDASCQRVDGDPQFNVGLLGILLNGKTRLLAIKNPDGSILARMLWRVLWDPKTKQPVLHMDRVYHASHIQKADAQKWLKAYAQKRAMDLGLALAGNGVSYPNTLYSLDGHSPYEYVDAAKGLMQEARYQINER